MISINNEVKVKTKIRDELKKSRYDPERVKGLMVTNQQKQEKVIQLQNEGTFLLQQFFFRNSETNVEV